MCRKDWEAQLYVFKYLLSHSSSSQIRLAASSVSPDHVWNYLFTWYIWQQISSQQVWPSRLQSWWRLRDSAGPQELWRRPRLHFGHSSWRPDSHWLTAALSLGSEHCTCCLNHNRKQNKHGFHNFLLAYFTECIQHLYISNLSFFGCTWTLLEKKALNPDNKSNVKNKGVMSINLFWKCPVRPLW